MARKVNLIFPAAGQGTRFGGVEYKPFLGVGDITFIEEAFNSFSNYKDVIESVILICTEEQNKKFNVENRLKEIIDHPRVVVVKIPESTPGPYQTVRSALRAKPELKSFDGVTIICDCDHTLDVAPIFEKIKSDEVFDVIIPCWNINKAEQKNWGKVVLSGSKIQGFVEKEIIDDERLTVKGMIGCMAFNDVSQIFNHGTYVALSDLLKELFKRDRTIKLVDIPDAGFFGDPNMLETYINKRRRQGTIFCDIDGVLIKHKPHSDFGPDNIILPGVDKLQAWKKNKHRIVLTTARNKKYRTELTDYLNRSGIPFDDIVMGLPAGQRFLINDRKPSKHFTKQSVAIELPRDQGLGDVDIDEHIGTNEIKLLSTFDGNSFARVYLVESGSKKNARKHILKNKKNVLHYNKLKRQYDDLNRFNFMMSHSAPQTYSETENDYEYFFDMEYLENYKKLSDFPQETQTKVLEMLLPKLRAEVYGFRKKISDPGWINDFLNKKIYPKFKSYEQDEMMKKLISSDEVVINSKKYLGLRKILKTLNLDEYNPAFISPVHGDLTFDNILYNDDTDDVKLIDMDGSDQFDASELDLGKLFQSSVANYNQWKNLPSPITLEGENEITCTPDFFEVVPTMVNKKLIHHWSIILNKSKEEVTRRGIFYMCTFFIRFIPFRQQISREHGLFALVLSIVWLNKLITNKVTQ